MATRKKNGDVSSLSKVHVAAATGSTSELDDLISLKYDINAMAGDGINGKQTPLMLAARNGHLEPVVKLLRSGAELETEDSHGQTALMRAVRGSHVAVIRVVVDYKANVNHQDHSGVSAVHLAVEMDSGEMINILVAAGANLELKSNQKSQFPHMTPLRMACSLNCIESVAELLELKADVDAADSYGTTCLLDALSRQKSDLMRLILHYKPDLYATSRQTEGVLPLSYAAGKLKTPFLILLVDAKVDVNRVDLGGKTALHFAARTNNTTAVEYLLRVGADYTLRDKSNRDPAGYGNQYGSKEAVKLLEAAWISGGKNADPLSQVKKNYNIKKKLGEGAFGKVLLVTHKRTGKDYACKFIKRKKLSDDAETYLDTEIQIMFEVPHPGICRLFEVIRSKQAVCLILEVLRGGDVLQRIVEKDMLDEKEAARVVRSVANTLGFLHGLGIIHRDLKPDNLMYRTKDKESEVVIVDFGVAKHLNKPTDFAMSACGTPLYLAPEVITGPKYTYMCDMWSLGVIMYVMLCGRPPFYAKDRTALFRKIRAGEVNFPDKYWKNVSEGAKDLIKKLLVKKPGKRATPEEVAAHPWIQQHSGLQYQDSVSKLGEFDEKDSENLDAGYAALERVVSFLVAIKRFYARFNLGKIDAAALRLLGAYRQGQFRDRSRSRGISRSDSPSRSRSSSLSRRLQKKPLQPLMVVHVYGFKGDFVIERKYEGGLEGMKNHWWVSGAGGQMHVVSPDNMTQVDRKGRSGPPSLHLHRRSSFVQSKLVDADITLQQEVKIIGPGAYAGKVVQFKMSGSKDDLMEITSKRDRVTLMFWKHMRLFTMGFHKKQLNSKEQVIMIEEAKRIQLMFLKQGASLKLTCLPDKTVEDLDHKVTSGKFGPNIFEKVILQCTKIIKSTLWETLSRQTSKFQNEIQRMRENDAKSSISMTNRLSLSLPRRFLDLMGSKPLPKNAGSGTKGVILESMVQIASVQSGDENTKDLQSKIRKILNSDLYSELNALAKVVGEESELLVPGRRLYFAGVIQKKSNGLFSPMRERKLVLCNDTIAWLTPKLKLQRFLPLNEITMTVQEPNKFCLHHAKKTYEFVANTSIEMKQWDHLIKKTKEEWSKQAMESGHKKNAKGEGVLSDIKQNRERQFARMKRSALRELVTRLQHGVEIKDRTHRLKTYSDCFLGEDLVKWMLSENLCDAANGAIRIGNELVANGYMQHVTQDYGFKNNNYLYVINKKSLRRAGKGAAIVASLCALRQTSFSKSCSLRRGGNQRIKWIACTAKVAWKQEGRSKVPHAVLHLLSETEESGGESITLADSVAKKDGGDPTKFRVIPGGVDLREDDNYYTEYQLACETEEQRDQWVEMLNCLASDKKTLTRNLQAVIDRAQQLIQTVLAIVKSHIIMASSDEEGIDLPDLPGALFIRLGQKILPLYLQDIFAEGDFPFPLHVESKLREILLQGLDDFFSQSMNEGYTDAMSSIWKLISTNSLIGVKTQPNGNDTKSGGLHIPLRKK